MIKLLPQYEQYLINKNKSPNTIKSYLNHIEGFLKFNNNPSILVRQHVLNYMSYLKTHRKSAQTRNAKLSAIRSFNEWLISIGIQKETIVISDDFVEIQKPIVSPAKVTDKEAQKFLDIIEKKESYRNFTIVAFMYYVGTRISETLDIQLSDLDLDNYKCRIYSGKGAKERIVLLNRNIVTILKKYLAEERPKYKHAKTSPYLFVSRQGEKITSYQTIETMFDKYSKKVNPHQLRHCMATFAATPKEKGGAGFTLQQLAGQLGHSSIQTVTKYVHPSMDELIQALSR